MCGGGRRRDGIPRCAHRRRSAKVGGKQVKVTGSHGPPFLAPVATRRCCSRQTDTPVVVVQLSCTRMRSEGACDVKQQQQIDTGLRGEEEGGGGAYVLTAGLTTSSSEESLPSELLSEPLPPPQKRDMIGWLGSETFCMVQQKGMAVAVSLSTFTSSPSSSNPQSCRRELCRHRQLDDTATYLTCDAGRGRIAMRCPILMLF